MSSNRTEPVLLVEDTPSLARLYQALLARREIPVEIADTAASARQAHQRGRHKVVLLDLMLPDGDGLDLLREMRASTPEVKAIVVTANGSINRAVEAMRLGAFDFLVKPFDDARLMRSVCAAMAALSEGAPITAQPEHSDFSGFIGDCAEMRAIYDTLRDVARSSATVFITGESGTGKEVCAEAVHALSTRRDKPFIALNCGAIPRDLMESEVFGHLKGSFTGAIADKQGAAAAADGGTLFLDELCEMDIDLQTKLLRFLQTSTIQPVGATQSRKVDVRIICATNRDPEREVAEGRFRADLFYRLFVVPIHMPPLRGRGRDVLEIAHNLLDRYAQEEGKRFSGFSVEVENVFLTHPWPGNVRELQNVLRNVAVRCEGESVTLDMLPARFLDAARMQMSSATVTQLRPVPIASEAPLTQRLAPMVGASMAELERAFIEATIDACDGSLPRAAHLLGLSPSTLYRKRDSWKMAAE